MSDAVKEPFVAGIVDELSSNDVGSDGDKINRPSNKRGIGQGNPERQGIMSAYNAMLG